MAKQRKKAKKKKARPKKKKRPSRSTRPTRTKRSRTPAASATPTPASLRDELLLRLTRPKDVSPSTNTAAKKLVVRARRTSGDISEMARLAVVVLEAALRCSGRDSVRNAELYRIMRLLLSLGGHRDDAHSAVAKGMAHALAANWWEVEAGALVLTKLGIQAARGLSPSALPVDWSVIGLPKPLWELAEALANNANEATANEILHLTTRNPSDTVMKYPKWQLWIDTHIKRIRRGVYRLE